jgi:DNA transformation protein
MAARSEFAGLVEELLQPVGPVEVRAMFGGHGVFLDGVMFALIAHEVLYLKADDGNAAMFERAGLEAFTYASRDRTITMSYRRAPDHLEDWPALAPWVHAALDAALRSRSKRGPRRRG